MADVFQVYWKLTRRKVGQNTETPGGSNNFIRFLDKELQPYINNKYQTENNNRTIGHSTAGLFVLYPYLHHEYILTIILQYNPAFSVIKKTL